MGEEQLAKLTVEVQHIKEKVDDIDAKLEETKISSRLAVLEDRQKTVFTLIHWGFAMFGTILSGIVLWMVTH